MLQYCICTGVVENDKVQVIFCKICDETGKNFRINDDDIFFYHLGSDYKRTTYP